MSRTKEVVDQLKELTSHSSIMLEKILKEESVSKEIGEATVITQQASVLNKEFNNPSLKKEIIKLNTIVQLTKRNNRDSKRVLRRMAKADQLNVA